MRASADPTQASTLTFRGRASSGFLQGQQPRLLRKRVSCRQGGGRGCRSGALHGAAAQAAPRGRKPPQWPIGGAARDVAAASAARPRPGTAAAVRERLSPRSRRWLLLGLKLLRCRPKQALFCADTSHFRGVL